MKKLAAILVVICLLPMAMGATITLTNTPNPNGNPRQIQGSGSWALANGETFRSITYQVTLKGGGQSTYGVILTQPTNGNWSCTLGVIAGTYNPTQVTFKHLDNNRMIQSVGVTDNKDWVVQ